MIPKVPDTSPEDFERESKILRLAERADYYNGVGLRDEYIRTLKRILELAPESERVWAELRAVESRPERKKDPEHEGLQGLFARTFKKDG